MSLCMDGENTGKGHQKAGNLVEKSGGVVHRVFHRARRAAGRTMCGGGGSHFPYFSIENRFFTFLNNGISLPPLPHIGPYWQLDGLQLGFQLSVVVSVVEREKELQRRTGRSGRRAQKMPCIR